MRPLFALLLMLASLQARAADPVWRGTIGTAAVVVELDPTGDEPIGRYFYVRHGEDIPLQGHRSGRRVVLHEGRDDGGSGANWTFDVPAEGRLEGVWTGKGRTLPIRLERFGTSTMPHDDRGDALRDAPFDYLRMERYALKAERAQSIGAYRIRWYVEPETGVRLFRVEGGYAPETLTR